MRNQFGWSVSVFISAVLLLLVAAPTAAQPFRCAFRASAAGESLLVTFPTDTTSYFFPYRVPDAAGAYHLLNRDLEMHWDKLYNGTLDENQRKTLIKFAFAVGDSFGRNLFNIPVSDYRLVYDYFRLSGAPYSTDPEAPSAVVLGNVDRRTGSTNLSSYQASDRSHADVYFPHRGRNIPFGGSHPSPFISFHEDSTTNPSNPRNPRPANSVLLVGPWPSASIDTLGTGWTNPVTGIASAFAHEFQHDLAGQTVDGGTIASILTTELFSAGAEAIAGKLAGTPEDDFPFTYSLMSAIGNGNYQARSAFMAYLAYNFAGDTSPTLASIEDDVLYKWARRPQSERSFGTLRDLMSDANCVTCVSRNYFHPGGVALDDTNRLALLLHNWRVATYVNNVSLDEGQYGYPPQYGFVPSTDVGAFQQLDGESANDVLSIPPEVVLSSRFLTRDTTIAGNRSFNGFSHPLMLGRMGAEYWIVRSDPSLTASGRDLVIRVAGAGVGLEVSSGTNCHTTYHRDGRLVASAVCYKQDLPTTQPTLLWNHPDWVHSALSPRWTDVDSLSGDLEFVVPSFGDSVKAVVVVLTLADGPSQDYAPKTNDSIDENLLRYQLNLSLRTAPPSGSNPTALTSTSTCREVEPTWAPADDTLAYVRMQTGVASQIRLRTVGGAFDELAYASSLPQRRPAWSPRGDWLAFSQVMLATAGAGEEFVAYNRITSELRTLSSTTSYAVDIAGEFSPNGQQLAYIAHETPDYGQADRWTLHRIDLSGANDVVLVSRLGPGLTFASPRWSPDGTRVWFVANDTLYSVEASGTYQGQLADRGALLHEAASFDLLSSAARLLVEHHGAELREGNCLDSTLQFVETQFELPFRRAALLDTTRGVFDPRFFRNGVYFSGPRWSPEGTRIAYSTGASDSSDVDNRDLEIGQVSWNHAPTWLVAKSPADTTLEHGAAYVDTIEATDPDVEALTYEAINLPSGMTLNSQNGAISWPSVVHSTTPYYVVLRAFDGSGGVRQSVICISTHATTPPTPIVNLNCEFVFSDKLGLTLTVPVDDGSLGKVKQYDVRYGTSQVTESNWSGAWQMQNEPTPKGAGLSDGITLTGLQACTQYYVAAKVKDEAGNWSSISNSISGTTSCGGGGGMGESARRVDDREARGPGVSSGSGSIDATAPAAGLPTRGAVSLSSIQVAGGLLVVESERTSGGEQWRLSVGGEAEHALFANDADSRIIVQRADEAGAFSEARFGSEFLGGLALLPAFGAQRRVIFRGDFVPVLAAEESNAANESSSLTLTGASHSRLGNLMTGNGAELSNADIEMGDVLTLDYVNSPREGGEAAWVLWLAPSVVAQNRTRRVAEGEALPTQFALHPARPNPFAHTTSLHFDLPREERVRLVVHDIQGREVARISDASWPAGRHAIEWNGRATNDARLAAGVYVCRFTAGLFTAQRKLTLLP